VAVSPFMTTGICTSGAGSRHKHWHEACDLFKICQILPRCTDRWHFWNVFSESFKKIILPHYV